MQRKSTGQPKEVSTVPGAAMMGQLLACSLKRGKPARTSKAGNWGCLGRVQVADGEGQAKSLGGSLGHARWIGPNSSEEGQG